MPLNFEEFYNSYKFDIIGFISGFDLKCDNEKENY